MKSLSLEVTDSSPSQRQEMGFCNSVLQSSVLFYTFLLISSFLHKISGGKKIKDFYLLKKSTFNPPLKLEFTFIELFGLKFTLELGGSCEM